MHCCCELAEVVERHGSHAVAILCLRMDSRILLPNLLLYRFSLTLALSQFVDVDSPNQGLVEGSQALIDARRQNRSPQDSTVEQQATSENAGALCDFVVEEKEPSENGHC